MKILMHSTFLSLSEAATYLFFNFHSLGKLIGFGQFGDVFQGIFSTGEEDIEVAVKTLKKGSKDIDKIKFLQEATIMGQFKHPNVVTTYGMVSERGNVSNNVKYVIIHFAINPFF